MSYLERLRAVSAGSEPAKPSEPGIEGFDGTETAHSLAICDDIRTGLRSLAARTMPRIRRPELWSAVVADASRLAQEGWAGVALALGWHPLQLWGCTRDGHFESLATWLQGRRLVLVDEASAITADGPQRFIFRPSPAPADAIFLWELP